METDKKEYNITYDEYLILHNEVFRPANKELWQKAFDIYNKETNSKLSTKCKICYSKVLYYIAKNELWK